LNNASAVECNSIRRCGERITLSIKSSWRSIFDRRPKWLRPPLWVAEQYSPRPTNVDASYSLVRPPSHTPVIGIATPTLNRAQFLKATIESVLSQNYPRLKYHVQDGGSSDATIALLKNYDGQLSWCSQNDGGQANAINLAFATIDCDIMAYLNSDDVLLPGALAYVASAFAAMPDVDLIYGNRVFIDSAGDEIGRAVLPKHDARALSWGCYVPQETLFWRRKVWTGIGSFDETFDYALDWDFMLRAAAAGFKFHHVPRFLACFRVHPAQKTQKDLDVGLREVQRLRKGNLGYVPDRSEIFRVFLPYLLRQFLVHWMYRCGLLRI
jgi:glycosyltransferase involved in cell wall biosynthesis